MPMQRYKPEQIVTLLQQIEVAVASGEGDAAGVPGSRDHHADVLPLAEGVWWAQDGAGETAERAGEGKTRG